MVLDLRTIYVVASLTLVVLGLLQFAAYATGRFQRWPFWWGASNLLLGAGSFCIALRGIAPDVVSVEIGNTVTLAGYVLMLAALRAFAGRSLAIGRSCLVIAAGGVLFVFVMNGASAATGRIVLGSVLFCLVDLAVIAEGVRLARREKLRSAWFLVALYVPTAAIFAARGAFAVGGQLGAAELYGAEAGLHAWLALSAVMFIMMRSMIMLLMASERSHNELARLAHHDPLTGALNRAGLARSFAAAGGGRSVLVIDVDHFKALNDRHGHRAGDEILQLLASVARAELRAGDLFARQGGDEFVAVLDETSPAGALRVAERIRRRFAAAVAARPDLTVHPTLSIGMAPPGTTNAGLQTMLARADEALYRSKRDGRNRVAAYGADAIAA